MNKKNQDKKEIFELKSNQLTASKKDLSEWYNQLMLLADIVDDRYDVKGMAVWKPYGYKIMQNIKKRWDELFQEAGIQEVYFPLIVPIEYCEQNPSWWQGFKSEGFKVIAGSDNKIQGIIRPTGEPAIYPMYSMWVRSKNDLPIRFYETVNSYRYETKSTRPLIRTREITVWHEIHTAHATREEAEEEFQLHMKLWDKLWNDLALPPFKVVKPIWECFPGAIGAVEYYSTTPNGRVMENGSVNNLGQAYAKKFNIKFKNEEGKEEYAWQICTGNGARLLGGLILVHGDNKGLIIPPRIAPIKVVIVPIFFKGKEKIVLEKAKELSKELREFDVYLDERKEKTAGEKFYEYEIKGIPLRIEIGPKDIEKNSFVLVRRDTGKKEIILNKDVKKKIKETLEDMQNSLLEKATNMLNSQIKDVKSLNEIKSNLKSGKISRAFWCKEGECYDKICETTEGLEGFGSDLEEKEEGNCIICNKKTKTKLYLARTY
jgi:prolyl-tRNA synthetase